MSLVAECGGGGQEEGAGDHEGDEGKTEEEERVAGEMTAVGGGDRVLVGGGAEFLGLEDGHCIWLIEEWERSGDWGGWKVTYDQPYPIGLTHKWDSSEAYLPTFGRSLDPPGCGALKRGR